MKNGYRPEYTTVEWLRDFIILVSIAWFIIHVGVPLGVWLVTP